MCLRIHGSKKLIMHIVLQIEEDAYQDDLGFSMGTLGSKAKSGRIRGPVVDSKTKARISKTLQVNLLSGLLMLNTTINNISVILKTVSFIGGGNWSTVQSET